MPAPPPSPPPAYKLCPRCRLIYPGATNFCGRDREPLVADDRIIAGRYILLHQVGSGTMSEVYAAEQPQLGRKVAIKLLRRDLDVVRRFYSEVRAVGQIRHEHVVTIHDSGRIEDGRPYIAMEYLEGEDLASHLKKHGRMDSARAMLLWRQAVSAVAAAHRRSVVHRDIKPANLFLTYKDGDEGPEEIIKVIDFSIAKLESTGSESRPTEPGAIVGTVLYMAPEQLAHSEATPRSDVYSLGLVLVEMLTGQLPWAAAGGDAVKVGYALQRLVNLPAPLRELAPEQLFSEELQQLASDVLSQEPGDRPADAGELLRRIKRLPEMRDWQRLPRRLSWSGTGSGSGSGSEELDTTPGSVRDAVPEQLTAKLTEQQTRKRQVTTDDRTVRTALKAGAEKGAESARRDSTWSPSGSMTELGDWSEEPTVPADGALLEQHMRSLEVALFAESRRAQNAGTDYSADTFSPVPRVASAQRAQRDDSSQRSKVNVFSAADLNDQLEAVPEALDEEPTMQQGAGESAPAYQPPLSVAPPPASRVSPVLDEPRPPSKTTGKVVLRRPAKNGWLQRWLFALAVAVPSWFLYRAVESLLVAAVAKLHAPRAAAVADLRPADTAVASSPDGSAAAGPIADLGVPPDLYSAPDDLTDGEAQLIADGVLTRARLYYNADDGVSEISCTLLWGSPKSSTQSQRVTLEVTLFTDSVCTVSGPGGTRVYTYAQLAKHRSQRSGEIRHHVQVRASRSSHRTTNAESSDATRPAGPVDAVLPAAPPKPTEPVDGG